MRTADVKTGLWGPVCFFLTAVLLLSTPLIRGGNRFAVLWWLEYLAVPLVGFLLLFWLIVKKGEGIGLGLGLMLASPLFLALLQLTDWGGGLWRSAQQPYWDVLRSLALEGELSVRSMNPIATQASLASSALLIAGLLAGLLLPLRHLNKLFVLLVVAALFQVVLSVAQNAAERTSWLFYGLSDNDVVRGTFANSNHFANYLVMAIPLTFYSVWHLRSRLVDTKSHGKLFLLAGLVAFLLLSVGVVASGSRTGLMTYLVVIGLSGYLFVYSDDRLPPFVKNLILVAAIGVALASFLLVGQGRELFSTWMGGRLSADAGMRSSLYVASLVAIQDFWPLGSGIGTFETIFPRYQPTYIREYVNYAHNDYLQLVVEAGVFGVGILLLCALLLSRRVLWLRREWKKEDAAVAGLMPISTAGIAFVAIALHSLFDFNWHIPANALVGAFLAGVFLRHDASGQDVVQKGRKKNRRIRSQSAGLVATT